MSSPLQNYEQKIKQFYNDLTYVVEAERSIHIDFEREEAHYMGDMWKPDDDLRGFYAELIENELLLEWLLGLMEVNKGYEILVNYDIEEPDAEIESTRGKTYYARTGRRFYNGSLVVKIGDKWFSIGACDIEFEYPPEANWMGCQTVVRKFYSLKHVLSNLRDLEVQLKNAVPLGESVLQPKR